MNSTLGSVVPLAMFFPSSATWLSTLTTANKALRGCDFLRDDRWQLIIINMFEISLGEDHRHWNKIPLWVGLDFCLHEGEVVHNI